jgi:hypothetical protein
MNVGIVEKYVISFTPTESVRQVVVEEYIVRLFFFQQPHAFGDGTGYKYIDFLELKKLLIRTPKSCSSSIMRTFLFFMTI